MKYISPSILSADFARLGEAIEMLNQSEAEWIHVDVMDGVFVPNISFGFPVMEPMPTLEKIRAKGVRTALTINPDIAPERLLPYLDKVDMVMLMSVFAGFGGQKFIPETLDKVRFIKQAIRERQLPTLIEVDGGVNTENAPLLFEAGADVLVAGSSVFRAPDPMEMIKKLKTTPIPSV